MNAPDTSGSRQADLRGALAMSAMLLAYGNSVNVLAERLGRRSEDAFRFLNLSLVAPMLAFAGLRPGGLSAAGLTPKGAGRSIAMGGALGLALSLPPLVFFFAPVLLDTPLEYGRLSNLNRRQVLFDLLVSLPVGTALFEELAFRGLLYGAFRRGLPAWAANCATAAVFAGWHFNVTRTSAASTNLESAARLPRFLRPYVLQIALVGGLLTTGIGGVLFGLLREKTGNLAGPVLAHLIVDDVMVGALWLRRPGAR